jgi:hypothetical protein
MNNYVVSIFGFANKYLDPNGCMLFFHDNDFWVLKDVKAYLEDYQFKIQSKWVIVNGFHWTSLESKSRKVTFYVKPLLTSKLYSFDHF